MKKAILYFVGYLVYMYVAAPLYDSKVFALLIVAPLAEELIFRYLPLTFVDKYAPLYRDHMWILSSAIFGFIHFQSPNPLAYQFVFGIAMGRIFLDTKKYWLVVLFHFIWNLICLLSS